MFRTLKTGIFAFTALFTFLVVYSQSVSVSAEENVSLPPEVEAINKHPATAKPVNFDSENIDHYRTIAAELGMDYDKSYGYREWADSKRQNEIGIAGHYEMLNFSTEGDPDDQQAMYASMREPHHWESFYFSNHDVTMLYVIKPAEAGRSLVKIIKVERGRVPEIHQ
ncbi:hypothetical protein Q673_06115 [Marinobacter sp. EN3]|uniref:hypothetical protein n=1 Tax=Marinobacter sp. EN3 TaxID=1397533 RepID=UPI0003B8071F|nr:hypothetical protein [Marinobacter sp. EN3]ERS04793.1 hypothetical protein Q673_06115 [Marinobacter sp. EN3]